MRLRNKKTGEIVERSSIVTLKYKISSCSSSLVEAEEYSSIRQLNEEWEDYEPAEPLIKDEKIRKAVRAWVEADGIEEVAVMCHLVWGEEVTEIAKISNSRREIVFKGDLGIKMGNYTIADLCGEEEE